jgi:hydrogenase maturation protease
MSQSIHSLLLKRLRGRVVIVGIGNRDCRDDGAGLFVIEKLSCSPFLKMIDAGDSPELILDSIVQDSPDVVMFVDSSDLDSEPGSAAIVEREQLDPGWGNGHQPPLSAIMTYVAERSGADTFLLGIQPADIGSGFGISPPVSKTVGIIADCINCAASEKEVAARWK